MDCFLNGPLENVGVKRPLEATVTGQRVYVIKSTNQLHIPALRGISLTMTTAYRRFERHLLVILFNVHYSGQSMQKEKGGRENVVISVSAL